MTLELKMLPKQPPLAWTTFVESTPRCSIALDGYVADGPRFDPTGPRANFNHHEKVSRLETRATCAQVLMAVRQGLYRIFRDEKGPQAVVFANDCDEDVCTAWFVLKHAWMSGHSINPLLNRLVALEDLLDTTAGSYPFPSDLPALRELAWVYEPYRRFRLSGELDKKDAVSYLGVVSDVEHRIMAYLTNKGGSIDLDTRYERLSGGSGGWAMLREVGAQARLGAVSDGIHAYVAVRERPDKSFTYTLWRMSVFIDFPVPDLLAELNRAEIEARHEGAEHSIAAYGDFWGGGDTVGGSPRVRGSVLKPDQVAAVVSKVLVDRKRSA